MSLVPAAPLLYGKNLGDDFSLGLSPSTVWGSEPMLAAQGPVWQCGAYVLE